MVFYLVIGSLLFVSFLTSATNVYFNRTAIVTRARAFVSTINFWLWSSFHWRSRTPYSRYFQSFMLPCNISLSVVIRTELDIFPINVRLEIYINWWTYTQDGREQTKDGLTRDRTSRLDYKKRYRLILEWRTRTTQGRYFQVLCVCVRFHYSCINYLCVSLFPFILRTKKLK